MLALKVETSPKSSGALLPVTKIGIGLRDFSAELNLCVCNIIRRCRRQRVCRFDFSHLPACEIYFPVCVQTKVVETQRRVRILGG